MEFFGNDLEKIAWSLALEHNSEKLQEILKRIMQGIMSVLPQPYLQVTSSLTTEHLM